MKPQVGHAASPLPQKLYLRMWFMPCCCFLCSNAKQGKKKNQDTILLRRPIVGAVKSHSMIRKKHLYCSNNMTLGIHVTTKMKESSTMKVNFEYGPMVPVHQVSVVY